MQQIMQFMHNFLSEYPWLETFICLLSLLFAAFIINFLVGYLLLRASYKLLTLIDQGEDADTRLMISRLTNVAPVLVFSYGIDLIPGITPKLAMIVHNVANAFITLTIALTISALLNFVDLLYRRRQKAKFRQIKGLIQIAKIVLYSVATILIVAILLDRSPLILLSGLGAMAAVLLLVFQDTLLSLVAGIQISSTDMVRIGDWIEIPSVGTNGDITEIALHTVKVKNFDNTITTVPIRKLVTDPVKNWRGMQESGGRRIKRSLYIDQSSIVFLTEKDIKYLSQYRQIKNYIKDKTQEISEWNKKLNADKTIIANVRKLTNIGTFRAYVEAYIKNHPHIHEGMTRMVRQLSPVSEGLPLEIYCFANTTVWTKYEAIQSDIFDHLYSIMPDFGLRVFQTPSGNDMQRMLANIKQPVTKTKSS
ncbi:MAG: miniconductance mechanosensitive channel [Candidatus Tokpelaia sp. JSC189]|nr:MAG: miniconductance mechanosensitive channel [Candidatus Tokpelaia sp. JSC189]